ncbi:MAG: hypothetical protein IPJ71_04195 [Bdellovibrionales bacterium]|nr:hypothetical protein [Bdellovibrionales bacterium]
MTVNPHAYAFSWRSFYRAYTEGERSFFSFNLDILFIDAGATAELTNRDTGRSANVAKLDVTLVQPVLTLALGHRLIDGESFNLEGGFGISFLPRSVISTRVRGSLPALLDVMPEARESIYDGMDDAKADLAKVLSKKFERFSILPAIFIQAHW